MSRMIANGVAAVLLLVAGTRASAGEHGTAAEARAMLERAVKALKSDEGVALAKFTNGEDGFKDRDLYPFCGGPDGILSAHPWLLGTSLIDLKDKTGKPLGREIYRVAQEGKVKKVTYIWVRPGTKQPVQKGTFVTRVGDQVCGVGYYE